MTIASRMLTSMPLTEGDFLYQLDATLLTGFYRILTAWLSQDLYV